MQNQPPASTVTLVLEGDVHSPTKNGVLNGRVWLVPFELTGDSEPLSELYDRCELLIESYDYKEIHVVLDAVEKALRFLGMNVVRHDAVND